MSAIYVDYSLPNASSSMPVGVTTEPARVSGTVVVGHWPDCGSDNLKLCATEAGVAITVAAWSGEAIKPGELPLSVTEEEIRQTTDDLSLEQLMEKAANSVGLCLDFQWTYAVLAQEANTLHPDLAGLLRVAQEHFYTV